MFLENADITCLQQGDILRDILFPRLTSSEVAVIARINPAGSGPVPTVVPMTKTHREDPQWLTAQLPVRCCYGVVMSQCCDLEPRNQRIVMPTFTVGRLIPIPKSILGDPQRLESLRANKDPRNPAIQGSSIFSTSPVMSSSATVNGWSTIIKSSRSRPANTHTFFLRRFSK